MPAETMVVNTNGNVVFLTGRVKFFDSRKGFGFIKPDDGSRDVFLSVNVVPKNIISLDPDTRCRFSVTKGKKGPAAREFSLL